MDKNTSKSERDRQIENTDITRNNDQFQTGFYQNKSAEDISDLQVQIESIFQNNTYTKGSLMKGKIVDAEIKQEDKEMIFTVEFGSSNGKFTINLIDEDSRSDKLDSLENRLGGDIETTSNFANQTVYVVSHENSKPYAFIPKRRHKMVANIFGDYCASKSDKIFRGGTCIAVTFTILSALATGGVTLGAGVGSTLFETILMTSSYSVISLILSFIISNMSIGISIDEKISCKQVYELTASSD